MGTKIERRLSEEKQIDRMQEEREFEGRYLRLLTLNEFGTHI
jgi:hypothetical protein